VLASVVPRTEPSVPNTNGWTAPARTTAVSRVGDPPLSDPKLTVKRSAPTTDSGR